MSIGGGVISDTFPKEKMGGATAAFSMGPLLGPVVGPVMYLVAISIVDMQWWFHYAVTGVAMGLKLISTLSECRISGFWLYGEAF